MTMLRLVKMRSYGSKCTLAMVILVFYVTTRKVIFNYLAVKDAMAPKQQEGNLQQLQQCIDCNVSMVTHMRFLKVHKCASTTMQNLFFRFALRHNLTVVLPWSGNLIYNAKAIIEQINQTGHYDIFACHTIYSKRWFEALPVPLDATNIAIVREPRARMISAAYKFRDGGIGYLRRVPQENFIQNLLRYPDIYDRKPFSLTKNSMGMDFGFFQSIHSNEESEIDQYLQFLEKEFQLVLVVERMHESLVLMRRSLNWGLEDIIYRVMHSFEHENVSLSNEDFLRMKKLNSIDYAIYEHFSRVFDRKIKNQTKDFHEEVQHLDRTIRIVTQFCDSDTVNDLNIKESNWNKKFILKRSECDLMKTKELDFMNYMRHRHKNVI